MRRLFWCDVETTGIDPVRNGLIQIAGLVEIDGVIQDEINLKIRPMEKDIIDDNALQIQGITREVIEETYQDPKDGLNNLRAFLEKHVSPYDKRDKLVIAGYNVGFDSDFVRQFFIKQDDKYFGSWFFPCKLDVMAFLADKVAAGLRLADYRLETVCAHFHIEMQAHDALSDIKATRELYARIR